MEKIYKINNVDYELYDRTIERMKYLEIELTQETIEKFKKLTPYTDYFSSKITMIVDALYFNKKFFSKDGVFGRIIRYSKNGEILGYFENMYDAALDHVRSRYYYGLERFHEIGIVPYECEIDFFGSKFDNKESCVKGEYNPIELLTRSVSKLQYWVNKCNKGQTFKSYVFGGNVTVDDKKLSWEYICATNNYSINIREYFKYRNDDSTTKEMLEKGINDLLDRYSCGECYGFKKVDDIEDFDMIPGVFVLELEKLNKVAVWYDALDVLGGVTYFLHGGPYSKCWIYPKDVSNIFLLLCDKTNVRKVYNDCVNFLPKELVIVYDIGNDGYKHVSENNPQKLLCREEIDKIVISVDKFVDERIKFIDSLDDDGMNELFDERIKFVDSLDDDGMDELFDEDMYDDFDIEDDEDEE